MRYTSKQLSLEALGSGDHLHRCVRYVLSAAQGGRPYLLLMPNYVCLKPFFRRASEPHPTTTHPFLPPAFVLFAQPFVH